MTQSQKPYLALSFLEATEAYGSYSQNYGNSIGCLTREERDVASFIEGPYQVQQIYFTRNARQYSNYSQKRPFKPGLKIVFEGATLYAPEISLAQFLEARSEAIQKSLSHIDLISIQQANRVDDNFETHDVKSSRSSGMALRAIPA